MAIGHGVEQHGGGFGREVEGGDGGKGERPAGSCSGEAPGGNSPAGNRDRVFCGDFGSHEAAEAAGETRSRGGTAGRPACRQPHADNPKTNHHDGRLPDAGHERSDAEGDARDQRQFCAKGCQGRFNRGEKRVGEDGEECQAERCQRQRIDDHQPPLLPGPRRGGGHLEEPGWQSLFAGGRGEQRDPATDRGAGGSGGLLNVAGREGIGHPQPGPLLGRGQFRSQHAYEGGRVAVPGEGVRDMLGDHRFAPRGGAAGSGWTIHGCPREPIGVWAKASDSKRLVSGRKRASP